MNEGTFINRFIWDMAGGGIVILLLIMLINPFDILMLDMGVMMVLSLFAVSVMAFAALVWRERSRDEREALLVGSAGRIAYLTGAGVLSVGIIVQTIAHDLDIWLVLALGLMIVSKLLATVYYQK